MKRTGNYWTVKLHTQQIIDCLSNSFILTPRIFVSSSLKYNSFLPLCFQKFGRKLSWTCNTYNFSPWRRRNQFHKLEKKMRKQFEKCLSAQNTIVLRQTTGRVRKQICHLITVRSFSVIWIYVNISLNAIVNILNIIEYANIIIQITLIIWISLLS